MATDLKGEITTTERPRVIWLQNSADHYFVQMLDALNAQGDVEYFGVFLCPPPTGEDLAFSPRAAPHAFLGDPVKNAGPEGHRSLGLMWLRATFIANFKGAKWAK
ncbi:MAG: hypothetical protein ACYCUV_12480 [Phycisphaerae bacterium]